MDKLILKSPAKINLFLKVLNQREDGYHEIVSLMQAVDLQDEMILEKRARGVEISTDHPDCPADESNLAFKAARLLLDESGTKEGVSIHIKKKIPIAAGLGGGSSNAATALKGVNRLFGLETSPDKLHLLASRLGSDVPFFLGTGQALATGRGERVIPVSIFRAYWLVLVYPAFKVSTQWAYQRFKILLTKKENILNLNFLENRDSFFEALPGFDNDLEEAVKERYPVIGQIEDVLTSSGAIKSSMSGSGSTVYGVFEQQPKAEEVARKIRRGDWEVFLTQPIPV